MAGENRMAEMDKAQTAQNLKHLKNLIQTPGWKILEDRLEKLLTSKEQELVNLLRAPSNEKMLNSIRVQGVIDGINLYRMEVRKMTVQMETEV